MVNVSPTSVHRWVHSHPATRPNRVNRRKVTDLVLATMKTHLDRDPFLTACDLVRAVQTECNVELSKNTIPSCLRRIQYSRKRTYARAPNSPEMTAERVAFKQRHAGKLMNDVISIDETCFYLDAKPQYGYAKKGTRIGVPLTKYRCSKVTLILAVGMEGVQHWELFHGNANGKRFAHFVTQIPILPCQRYLLMDNVKFHSSKCTCAALEQAKLEPLFNAPYTPEWNPVEYIFSKVKRMYMRGRRPEDDVDRFAFIEDRIYDALNTVSIEDTTNCFRHCWRCIHDGTIEKLVFQMPEPFIPLL